MIALCLAFVVVDASVDLNDQLTARTIEIEHESVEAVLTTKLQTAGSLSKRMPQNILCVRQTSTQRPRHCPKLWR